MIRKNDNTKMPRKRKGIVQRKEEDWHKDNGRERMRIGKERGLRKEEDWHKDNGRERMNKGKERGLGNRRRRFV